MSFYRTVRMKLADRFEAFDTKNLYRKPPRTLDAYRVSDGPRIAPIDRLLIGMAGLVLSAIGLFGLIFAGLILWALFAS